MNTVVLIVNRLKKTTYHSSRPTDSDYIDPLKFYLLNQKYKITKHVLIMTCHTFIAHSTMLWTERLPGLVTSHKQINHKMRDRKAPTTSTYHTINTEGLSIKTALRCKIFDNLRSQYNQNTIFLNKNVRQQSENEMILTALNSPSLEGFGQVPGSNVIARTKL